AVSAHCEATLYRAVVEQVNPRVGRSMLLALLGSAGTWIASNGSVLLSLITILLFFFFSFCFCYLFLSIVNIFVLFFFFKININFFAINVCNVYNYALFHPYASTTQQSIGKPYILGNILDCTWSIIRVAI